ncbi:MAG: prepilin-type N-terminal cleavage/methylation domain-containing protein [Planctomycetota bacterium]
MNGKASIHPQHLARPAFSLVEMMIAIVILGLGMVMVATMFPIAWTRARQLGEHTAERSVSAGLGVIVESLVEPSSVAYFPLENRDRVVAAGLAGDLIFDPSLASMPIAFSDTRVHALHLENILVEAAVETPVPEDSWKIEQIPYFFDPDVEDDLKKSLKTRSLFDPRVRFEQRVHPPMPPSYDSADPDTVTARNEQLSRRRFAWAVLHRLTQPVGPDPNVLHAKLLTAKSQQEKEQIRADAREQSIAGMGSSRILDVYYVTLRRPGPTDRFTRQDVSSQNLPDPLNREHVATPKAEDRQFDVQFPIAWRMQIQLPAIMASRAELQKPAAQQIAEKLPTGIPTEATIPPQGITGAEALMFLQIFRDGTRFIDEVNGQVYRVVRQRITDAAGEQAALTLDREIVVEDVDDSTSKGLKTSFYADGIIQTEERMRTVWVFPPSVDRSAGGAAPLFAGAPPVVDIDVRTLALAPNTR